MDKDNKVKYNIKNVHIAKVTETVTESGTTYTYGTPKAMPGAKSISLSPEGEVSKFYADGIVYFVSNSNNGYSGDLEMAYIPAWFREEILNEEKDDKGVLIENANAGTSLFALLFEFDGDENSIRRVLYNCTTARPGIESETVEDTKEPGTETLSLTISPRADGMVKAQNGPETDKTTYANWYKNVYEPTVVSKVSIEKTVKVGE